MVQDKPVTIVWFSFFVLSLSCDFGFSLLLALNYSVDFQNIFNERDETSVNLIYLRISVNRLSNNQALVFIPAFQFAVH